MTHLELLADFFEPCKPLLIHLGELETLMARGNTEIQKGTRGVARTRGLTAMRADRTFPRKGEDWSGSVDLPGMTISGSDAIIPVYGMIGDKLDPMAKWYFNATDLRDVNNELAIAKADPSVKRVGWIFDTPGGSSRNLVETSDAISQLGKPQVAFVDGMAASAGYWMASATGAIAATRGSDIGSIGVYSTFYDRSKLADSIGIKVQVFSSGKFKGMGVPGTSLSTEQAAWIQQDVNDLAKEFKDHVRSSRWSAVPDSAMEGQTFSAPQAKENGLIDFANARSIQDAFTLLR